MCWGKTSSEEFAFFGCHLFFWQDHPPPIVKDKKAAKEAAKVAEKASKEAMKVQKKQDRERKKIEAAEMKKAKKEKRQDKKAKQTKRRRKRRIKICRTRGIERPADGRAWDKGAVE